MSPKDTHPNAGFFSSLFDPWFFLVAIGLGILNAVINRVFFKGVIDVTEADLAVMANEVNKDCPTEIDQLTRLDGAIAGPGLKFTYKYTLKLSAQEAERLREGILKRVSTQWTPENELTPIYEAGVEFLYDYRGEDGSGFFALSQKKGG